MNNFERVLGILQEMSPKNIEPLDSEHFKEESRKYYDNNKSKFKPTNTKYLLKSGDNNNGYYMLVVDGVVEYFANYKSKSYQSLLKGRMIRQVLVQRNEFSIDSANIPKKVFFDYLLPTFGTIVTDEEQTNDGKKFWLHATSEALDQPEKYTVYILNKNKGKTTKIEDNDHFKTLTDNIWGDTDCFKNIWIAISLK